VGGSDFGRRWVRVYSGGHNRSHAAVLDAALISTLPEATLDSPPPNGFYATRADPATGVADTGLNIFPNIGCVISPANFRFPHSCDIAESRSLIRPSKSIMCFSLHSCARALVKSAASPAARRTDCTSKGLPRRVFAL
jgi:hypothetical protein